MKYFFEKLEPDVSLEMMILKNIYFKLLNAYDYDKLNELIQYIEQNEPRIKKCHIEINNSEIIITGEINNEERVLKLQK